MGAATGYHGAVRLVDLKTQALRYLALGEPEKALLVYRGILLQVPSDLDSRMRVADGMDGRRSDHGLRRHLDTVRAALKHHPAVGGKLGDRHGWRGRRRFPAGWFGRGRKLRARHALEPLVDLLGAPVLAGHRLLRRAACGAGRAAYAHVHVIVMALDRPHLREPAAVAAGRLAQGFLDGRMHEHALDLGEGRRALDQPHLGVREHGRVDGKIGLIEH